MADQSPNTESDTRGIASKAVPSENAQKPPYAPPIEQADPASASIDLTDTQGNQQAGGLASRGLKSGLKIWLQVVSAITAHYMTHRRVKRAYLQDMERFITAGGGATDLDAEIRTILPTARVVRLDGCRRYYDAETARRKGIEEKARNNFVAITVATPVVFLGAKLLLDIRTMVGPTSSLVAAAAPVCAAILLIVGILYLLGGGLMAMEAVEVGIVFAPQPDDEVDSGPEHELLAARILTYAELNQRSTFIRSNALSVSNHLMRNGILCISILAVALAVLFAIGPSASNANPGSGQLTLSAIGSQAQPSGSASQGNTQSGTAISGPPSVQTSLSYWSSTGTLDTGPVGSDTADTETWVARP